jgi:hypothetical protein
MGSFFTNVQVHARRLDPGQARDGVIDALRRLLSEEGFVPADGEGADRTIVVDAGREWISVYDEACEGQQQDILDRLALALSKRLETEALTILVHDSDVLELRLFRSGEIVDRFNNNPSYFGKANAAERTAAAGNADRWGPILSAPADVEGLRAVWAKETLFAEDTLAALSELVGLDRDRASTGYSHLEQDEPDDPRYVKLAFRHSVRPAQETPLEGPPSFEWAGTGALPSREGGMPMLEVSAGFPWQISSSVRNVGGSSRGVSVVVWGDALDQGLLSADSVEITAGGSESRVGHGAAPFLDRRSADGKKLRMATFADLTLPPGHRVGLDAWALANPTKAFDLMFASKVHANVHGKGLAKGEATLHVGFIPATNLEGQFAQTLLAKVHPPSRRPLRSAEDVDAYLLRPLDGRESLFALVSMDLDPVAAADVASQAIERWGRLFDAAGQWSISVSPAEEGARPRTGTAKAKRLFGGARWKKLQEQLRTEWSVHAERAQERDIFSRLRSGDGFAFGRSGYRIDVADDPELPTLGLWFDAGAAPETRIDEASKLACELMDAIMTRHQGVQALSGRWAWAPSSSLDMTPYETACGVGGQCTLRRSWVSRFARGVTTGTLWLGAPLAARVPDVARLRSAAQVTSLGEGLRITVENDAALDDVEAALAPLLPSKEDWGRGAARLYSRAQGA